MGQVLRIAMRRLGWAARSPRWLSRVRKAEAEIAARAPGAGPGGTSSAAATSCKEFLPAQVSDVTRGKRGEIAIEHRGYRVAPVDEIAPQMIGAKAGVRDDRRETAGVVAVGGGFASFISRVCSVVTNAAWWMAARRRGRWRERCDLGRRQVRKLRVSRPAS